MICICISDIAAASRNPTVNAWKYITKIFFTFLVWLWYLQRNPLLPSLSLDCFQTVPTDCEHCFDTTFHCLAQIFWKDRQMIVAKLTSSVPFSRRRAKLAALCKREQPLPPSGSSFPLPHHHPRHSTKCFFTLQRGLRDYVK